MGQKKLNPNLLQGIEGTLLGAVLSTTNEETATFLKEVGDESTDTDKKVTDILPLEAAILMHAKTNDVAAKKLIDDLNTQADAKMQEYNNKLPADVRKALLEKKSIVESEVDQLQEKAKLLSGLAWASIDSRVGDIESMTIRAGGTIVDTTEVCPNCGKVHGKHGLLELLEFLAGK